MASATLWDRGGGMIYDDVLNITLLQDANYAKTSGYSSNGQFQNWSDAVAWVDQLVYGGYDDWRLPKTLLINGSDYIYSSWASGKIGQYSGAEDMTYNVSAPGTAYSGSGANEMAYMFYNNMGYKAYFDTTGASPQAGWSSLPNFSFIDGNGNIVSFINVQYGTYVSTHIIKNWYWSGIVAPFQNSAFCSDFLLGCQGAATQTGGGDAFFVWPVRDGDVRIFDNSPNPSRITNPMIVLIN